ncbi:MAG TPA: molybdopterin cofactor-binding domain-containing protein, partial [Magnetospirillaceae bacterium]|nr:molybdopterin cofactor-binding domain-containing protein [Magnetospirillaceae bacterium]
MSELGLPPSGLVHTPLIHDSAPLHVAGTAVYVDDAPEPRGLLHLAFGQSGEAHARIVSMDLSAVKAAPGVVAVLTAADIPGANNVAPVAHDDLLLAEELVEFVGQPLFLVAATSVKAARMAARLGKIEYESLPVLSTIEQARAAESRIEPDQVMRRGDVAKALAEAPCRLQGQFELGGQEHFYLEGQVALAIPGEDN